eukprot:354542-Chlamydomonas_euryale.AAC.15
MSEPLAAALRGTSALARRLPDAREHVHAFLAVLAATADGARSHAEAAARETEAALEGARRHARDAEAEAGARAGKVAGAAGVGTGSGADDAPGGAQPQTQPQTTPDAPGVRARVFFTERLAAKAADAAVSGVDLSAAGSDERGGSGGAGGGGSDGDGAGEWRLSAVECAAAEARLRRAHAAACLLASCADASAPLLASSSLRDAVAAAGVLLRALSGLALSTRSVETDVQLLEEGGGGGGVRPVRPDTPRLLPTVAGAWPHVVAALRDPRPALAETALGLLADAAVLGGGGFMAARLGRDAAPLLLQLVRSGSAAAVAGAGLDGVLTASCSGGGGGGDGRDAERLAPASVQRVRAAALSCMATVLAKCDSTPGVRALAWPMAVAALPWVGRQQQPPLRGAAVAALVAAASVDADAVWMLLYDCASGAPVAAEARCSGGSGGGALDGLPARWRGACSAALRSTWPVTPALQASCGAAAAELLPRVEAMTPAWHAAAPVYSPDWARRDGQLHDSYA